MKKIYHFVAFVSAMLVSGLAYGAYSSFSSSDYALPRSGGTSVISGAAWNRILDNVEDLNARSGGNGASVSLSAAASIPTTSWTTISWNSEEYDDSAFHDNSSNPSRLTVSVTGRYRITGSACFSSTDNGGYGVDFFKNGTSMSKGNIFIATSGTTYGATMQCANSSFSANLVSGDYLEMKAMVGVGSARNLIPGYSFFQIERIK